MAEYVTPITTWRKAGEGELKTLPSGNVALLRRVHVMALVEQGKVPDTLTPLVAQLISTNPQLKITIDDLKHYADVVNIVVKAAFLEPKLADEPGEDCLDVQELDFADRAAVFEWCHISTEKLRPFRPEQERAVETVPDGDGVREAAV